MDHICRIQIIDKNHWENVMQWCAQYIGTPRVDWGAVNYAMTSATFMFKKPEGLAAFVEAWEDYINQ